MERKRIHMNTSLKTGTGSTVDLIATIDESNGVNAHNLHLNFVCEPDTAGANATGTWVLYCIPDETSGVPTSGIAELEAEGSNAFIWACGLWAASNETPFCSGDVTFGTTRNCQNGARLVLAIDVEGITAGGTRINKMITYNTKSL